LGFAIEGEFTDDDLPIEIQLQAAAGRDGDVGLGIGTWRAVGAKCPQGNNDRTSAGVAAGELSFAGSRFRDRGLCFAGAVVGIGDGSRELAGTGSVSGERDDLVGSVAGDEERGAAAPARGG
jgi:hypothetical protein